jgi:hypothetical protein
MRCLEIKKNGEQCKSQSVTDGIFCYFHDPDNKETLQKGRELAWSREYLDFDVLPREEIEDIVDKKNVNKASNADNRVVLKALTVLYRYLRDETEVGQWLWTKDWQDADISVNIGALHSAQMNVYTTESKRKCLSMGRRAGKTWLAARVSIRMAAMGHRVLYACPTSDQTDAYWEMVSMLCRDLPITKYESNRTINFGTGGKIKAKTAWDADSLRGDYADLLILDEYAYMDADAWEKVGQPMLLDNGGTAWFISTPKFRNHFFTLFSKAETSDRWASFHCTSHDNPHFRD